MSRVYDYKTESEKFEELKAQHWREMYYITKQELEKYQRRYRRLRTMLHQYNEIKRVLTLAGENPEDYGEEI